MLDDRLGVEVGLALNVLERARDRLVPARARLGLERADDRRAHEVVCEVEDHAAVDPPQRDEPLVRVLRGLVVAADDARRVRRDLDRERTRRDADDREHRLRVGGQLGRARGDEVVDRHCLDLPRRRARELGDEERVATRHGDDRVRARGVAAELRDQGARVGVGEREDLELSHVARALEPRDDAQVVLGAVHEHGQHAGVRLLDQLGDDTRAVGVAPVHVVDEQHDRPHAREPRDRAPQRLEPAPANLLRIGRRR